jgi:hypothetical protein
LEEWQIENPWDYPSWWLHIILTLVRVCCVKYSMHFISLFVLWHAACAHHITGDQLGIGDGFWQAILSIFNVIDELRVTVELERSSPLDNQSMIIAPVWRTHCHRF